MKVLIVEGDPDLGSLWGRHIERCGAEVMLAQSQEEAIEHLHDNHVDAMVLNLILPEGSAMAVADYASYRHPAARAIFVTNTGFFSDGSIFQHIPNACAFVRDSTRPEDLAAMVEYYGAPRKPGRYVHEPEPIFSPRRAMVS